MTETIQALRDQTAALVDDSSTGFALALAVEMFDQALFRLGHEPLPGHPQETQEDPLVLRGEPGVSPDQ